MKAVSGYDENSGQFRSVGIRALDAAQNRARLAIVTTDMIARGLPPVRYMRSRGRMVAALFISTGLPRRTFLAEFLLWRELGRFIDDGSGSIPQDRYIGGPGRWSKNLHSASQPPPVSHSLEISKLVGVHTFASPGPRQFDYAEAFDLSPLQTVQIAGTILNSARERWVDIVASTIADPTRMATASPLHYGLVRGALWSELAVDLPPPET